MRPNTRPEGVEDWSLDWLKIQKDLREYLEQANQALDDDADPEKYVKPFGSVHNVMIHLYRAKRAAPSALSSNP